MWPPPKGQTGTGILLIDLEGVSGPTEQESDRSVSEASLRKAKKVWTAGREGDAFDTRFRNIFEVFAQYGSKKMTPVSQAIIVFYLKVSFGGRVSGEKKIPWTN